MPRRPPPSRLPPQLSNYLVNDRVPGKMLGPHKISVDEQGQRVVQLTERQAKYWLDQEALTPA